MFKKNELNKFEITNDMENGDAPIDNVAMMCNAIHVHEQLSHFFVYTFH